ncbi:MAG: archaemetzincin family Zn-dependent metalloprotease [Candidatus Hodarchaeota archaeon]
MKKIVNLLKIGQLDQAIFEKLKKELEYIFREFNISVDSLNDLIPIENSEYNIKRNQYNASKILDKINIYVQGRGFFRVLGIVDKDIFTSSLNFVFGLAMSPYNNKTRITVISLISITRLRESFYRRPEDAVLFEKRILKEAIHELGHTFGLPHCYNFCIMRFSNSIADTDYKPSSFCKSCLGKLRNFFKNL